VGVWRRTRTVSRYHQEENLMSPPNLDSMEGRSRINCDFSSMVYYNWKVEVVLNILLWKSGTRHLGNKSRTALKSIHHILWNPKPNFLALNYLSSVAPSWLINHSLHSHKVLKTIPQPSTCSLLTPSRNSPSTKHLDQESTTTSSQISRPPPIQSIPKACTPKRGCLQIWNRPRPFRRKPILSMKLTLVYLATLGSKILWELWRTQRREEDINKSMEEEVLGIGYQ
jgi:hypothetical protein